MGCVKIILLTAQYIICNTVYCLLQVYNENDDNVNILNSSMLLSLSIPFSHKVTLKLSQRTKSQKFWQSDTSRQ